MALLSVHLLIKHGVGPEMTYTIALVGLVCMLSALQFADKIGLKGVGSV